MAIVKYKKSDGFGFRAFVQVSPTKQITKCFSRKIDAESWVAGQRKLLQEGRAVLAAPTVAEFTAVWLKDVEGRRSFATHQRYEGVIRLYVLPTFGSIRMKDLNPYSAEQWQLEMAQMLHRKTVNTHFGVFQKCLNDAVRWRKLSFNPLASVQPLAEPEQEIRFLTADELAKLLAHVRDLDYGAFAIFAVAAMTGMRLAEVQGLKWDCISFQTGKITVKRIWDSKARKLKETTKTKTIRVIPMAQDLRQLLIPLANEKDAADFLFFGVDRLRFNFHGAAKVLRGFCRGAGAPEIRFHDLRHSFASNFVMAGGNIYNLQRMLGHSSVTMTERYSHLSPDHLNGATDILKFGVMQETNVIPLQSKN